MLAEEGEENRLAKKGQLNLQCASDRLVERQMVVEGFERLEYDSAARMFTCVVKKGCAPAWRAHNRICQNHDFFVVQFPYLRYQCHVTVREEE